MIEPVILAQRSTDADSMAFDLDLPAEHPAFAGHFPGQKVLPGVVQIDWAVRLAETHLNSRLPAAQDFQVKFRRVIAPGDAATLELRIERARGALHFTYRVGDGIASTGRCRLEGAA
jgi:3-hydroxyacyl-[acyl-carrier-protein] dehydratase